MMEMRLVLATIISRIRLESLPTAPIDPIVNITMSLRRGLPMRVRDRELSWASGYQAVPGEVHRYVDLAPEGAGLR